MFEQRQFISEMEYQYDQPLFSAHKDFMVVAGDNGRDYRTQRQIFDRTPASARDAEQMEYDHSLKRELSFLENKLSESEYQEYIQYQDKLGNISQKIYFLRLSEGEKTRYLTSRGIIDTKQRADIAAYSPRASNFYQAAIAAPSAQNYMPRVNDIALGMTKDDVVQNWGQPERREVAGDPNLQNERWAYRKAGSVKYIYFESGRVEGWTEH